MEISGYYYKLCFWNKKWLSSSHDSLINRIKNLGKQNINCLTQEQKEDLQKAFKIAYRWTSGAGKIKELLSTLPEQTIKTFMIEMMTSVSEVKIEYFLKHCLSLLKATQILELAGLKDLHHAHVLFKIQGLTKSTALKNHFLEEESQEIMKVFLYEFKLFCSHFLNLIVAVTGINELESNFQHDQYQYYMGKEDARYTLKYYWKLLRSPTLLFGLIYSYVRYTSIAALLTGIILLTSLTAFFAYKRYWKQCPIECPGIKNFTVEMLRDKNLIYPRREILQQINEAFAEKKGVILVGEPGCGKTWIARSFAQQASAGKICTFIKNPQVFLLNKSIFASKKIERIQEVFKNYSDQVVFFIDEFHSLFKPTKVDQGSEVDKIKTFCDDLKYIIGATTTKEYEEHIQPQTAISERRFKIIKVGAMANEEMRSILSHYIESHYTTMGVDPGVIDYILEKCTTFNPGTSPIDAAQSLLNLAIEKMTSAEKAKMKFEKKVFDLESELAKIEQKMNEKKFGNHIEEMQKIIEELTEKKKEIVLAKSAEKANNLRILKMQKLEACQFKLKKQSYILAQPNVDLISKDNARLAREWIELQVCIQVIGERISKERMELGLPPCFDKRLIEEILEESYNK